LSKRCQQWWQNNKKELRAYLANEEHVTSNPNPLKPKNPVVSEIDTPEVFIKFSIVENGIKMESSLGKANKIDNARFTKLVYQVTTEKQNSNILKHLSMTGVSQENIDQVVDLWQRLKITENEIDRIQDTKKKVVVRASQVLGNNKE